jgi:hypothetical protein
MAFIQVHYRRNMTRRRSGPRPIIIMPLPSIWLGGPCSIQGQVIVLNHQQWFSFFWTLDSNRTHLSSSMAVKYDLEAERSAPTHNGSPVPVLRTPCSRAGPSLYQLCFSRQLTTHQIRGIYFHPSLTSHHRHQNRSKRGLGAARGSIGSIID